MSGEDKKSQHKKQRSRRNVSPRALIKQGDVNGDVSQMKSVPAPIKDAEHPEKKGSTVQIPIRIRVGMNEARPTFVPDRGEPLFTLDDRRFWVGDGITPGGVPVSVSQWPINDVTDLQHLEDAEIGDFAFYRDRTRCFMLVNPPPSSKVAWMELHVEPLVTDDEKKARRYLDAIQNYLIDILLEEKFVTDEAQRLLPKKTTDATIAKLMHDRQALNTYLATPEKERKFPTLQYKSYSKL